MNVPPVPAPRLSQPLDQKKPVPTPRKTTPKPKPDSPDPDLPHNTFSRRVRSLSNASRQIAEDIGELVQDKKKAMIAGTRQSVRRITKRFNTNPQEAAQEPEPEEDDFSYDLFRSISFESPISSNTSVYNNVDEFNAPPPSHPPPPPPQDIIYDAPPSISGSTSNSEQSNVGSYGNYESVFPIYSNSESDLSRSGSWRFYDPVSKVENIYNDVDGAADTEKRDDFDVNSNVSSVDVRNSVYENHVILGKQEKDGKCRESVILQFDPLRNLGAGTDGEVQANEDIKILEEFFNGDLYGNVSIVKTVDDWSISNDSEPEEFITPPTPPIRVDSLPEEEQQPPQISPREKSRSQWFTIPESPKENSGETKKFGWWKKQFMVALEKAPDVVKGARNKDAIVQRPELEVKSFVHKKGMLYKVQSGPVEDLFGEYSGRWCILQNSNFICYSDSSCDSIKEHFPAESILSVQILQDPKFKYKYDNDDLHCFELNTTGKSRGGHIYGARDIAERRVWMQCIVESLTKKFPAKITTDYSRTGWAYLREGVGGKWVGAWLMLSGRNLYYAIDNQPTKTMDLRKVRCMVLQAYQENDNNPRTNDKGPNIVVDTPTVTLYLRMWTSRETKVWCHIVKLAAHNNGAHLEQQQLTKNDIPVLVEKCINFIYTHGSMSEGIYRRSGTSTSVSEILAKFRRDSWAVQLTLDKYTEHDVATALKRFIRDLPEPVLSSNQRQYLRQVSLIADKGEKIRMYKAALDQLPPISYKTAKKLLGHLHFVASQHKKNLMHVENLAAVWGPSLMHHDEKDQGAKHLENAVVVRQLLEMYRDIFPEDPADIEKEKLMLQVLEKHTKAPQGVGNSKKAGDFRVWIYLLNKEGQPVNVAIGPNKTAYDVCVELSSKMNMLVDDLILEEVVLNDKLQRPVHFSEKVLDIVLGWSYWEEADRKDNHLVLLPVVKYAEFIQDKSISLSAELRFADSRTRAFKMFMFEFAQAKLNCYKDRTCEEKLVSYNVEDITWYLGHESRRSPQFKWTMTFVDSKTHPTRTKNSPYFGNVLMWTDPQTRAKWIGSMLKARYKDGLKQPAMHVNLMSN